MNIKKFVVMDNGFGYKDIANNETIRFELGGNKHIDCTITELEGEIVLSLHGDTNDLGQLKIMPRVANNIMVGF